MSVNSIMQSLIHMFTFMFVQTICRKNSMSHNARAKKRARIRKERRQWDTVTKFAPYQTPAILGVRTRSRATPAQQAVIHRTTFREADLMFVDFGLAISSEEPFGNGLRTITFIPAFTPITQYEGILMNKSTAEAIREGPHGKTQASHFASTSARSIIINGFSLSRGNSGDNSEQGGVPLALVEWRGRGGGSLCNHSDEPNAQLVRDGSGDGYGVFVVSRRDICAGEFIHVDYGKSFIRSSKSNF
jgi:hypothetical protein